MREILQLLADNASVSDYKINIHQKESYELFFVKGRLETLRCTDTCDKEVTVYSDHDGFRGDAQFFVYPSTTKEDARALIQEAVDKALLIRNQAFDLPAAEKGSFDVPSNFSSYDAAELAAIISRTVFEANTIENAALNSVEVFINKHTERIINSRGLDKTQVRYDAMVEAIPTYNGATQSVELYEQYTFSSLDADALGREIAEKMEQVKARYEAKAPVEPLSCPVVLNIQEVSELMREIAWDLNYSSVYSHSNLFKKGEPVQKEILGDPIGITMAGQVEGSVRSRCFDEDGLSLGSIRLVDKGKAMNYFGSNRYGQYLGEKPTGSLPCLCADAGTAVMPEGDWLEIISMSGLQVDFYNDYIGGEVRLAYHHTPEGIVPVTGISVSGSVAEVLKQIRFSPIIAVFGGYQGPDKAVINNMKIY